MARTKIMAAALATAAMMVAGTAYAQVYLRAEIGNSWAKNAGFRDDVPISPNCFIAVVFPGVCGATLEELGSSSFGGVGVGFQTGSFRGEVAYSPRRTYGLSGMDPEQSFFSADVKAELFMLNGFYDLPVNWGPVRPFVGAGIGRSRNKLNNIVWTDSTARGVLPGGRTSETAWQVTAGVAINIAPKWNIDIAYRYLDMGKFRKDQGPDIVPMFNPSGITGPATGKLRADEITLGVRFTF